MGFLLLLILGSDISEGFLKLGGLFQPKICISLFDDCFITLWDFVIFKYCFLQRHEHIKNFFCLACPSGLSLVCFSS